MPIPLMWYRVAPSGLSGLFKLHSNSASIPMSRVPAFRSTVRCEFASIWLPSYIYKQWGATGLHSVAHSPLQCSTECDDTHSNQEYIYEWSLNPHTDLNVLDTSPTWGIQIDITWYASLIRSTVCVDHARHAKRRGCALVQGTWWLTQN